MLKSSAVTQHWIFTRFMVFLFTSAESWDLLQFWRETSTRSGSASFWGREKQYSRFHRRQFQQLVLVPVVSYLCLAIKVNGERRTRRQRHVKKNPNTPKNGSRLMELDSWDHKLWNLSARGSGDIQYTTDVYGSHPLKYQTREKLTLGSKDLTGHRPWCCVPKSKSVEKELNFSFVPSPRPGLSSWWQLKKMNMHVIHWSSPFPINHATHFLFPIANQNGESRMMVKRAR